MNRALRRRHLRAVDLLEAEGATGTAVAQAVGATAPTATRNYLARLASAGLVDARGRGTKAKGYVLTAAGRRQLLVDEVVRAADDPAVSEDALRAALNVLRRGA
jgi:hypothetical protein